MDFLFRNRHVGPLLFAYERDKDEITKLSQYIRSALSIPPASTLIKYIRSGDDDNASHLSPDVTTLIATASYYLLTTGLGYQTLGEELGLLVPHHHHRSPSRLVRLLVALLETFGFAIVFRLLRGYLARRFNLTLQPQHVVGVVLPVTMVTAHMGQSFAQMVLGIENHIIAPSNRYYPFFLIILLDLTYLIYSLYTSITQGVEELEEGSDETSHDPPSPLSSELSSELRLTSVECIICRECIPQGRLTTTSCGHLGCWDCLNRLGVVSNQCPICRSEVLPIVVLRNITKP